MAKTSPSLKRFRQTEARLKAKSDKLRFQLVCTDLDAATNFLNLARLDFQYGETEHASELLQKAQRAADVITKLADELPEPERAEVRPRIEALVSAIATTPHVK